MEFEKNIQHNTTGQNYFSYTQSGIYTYNKSWFDELIDVPFENMQVRVPKGYHEYLTFMYGDYMTPSQVNKNQDNTHTMSYLNLSERLNMKEVKNRIKKGIQYEL